MFSFLWKILKLLAIMSIGFYAGFIFRERGSEETAGKLSNAFSRSEAVVAEAGKHAWTAVSGLWPSSSGVSESGEKSGESDRKGD